MLALIITLSARNATRALEVGALLYLIGGLLLAAAGVRPSWQKAGLISGGLLLVVGSVLVIGALHYGPAFFQHP